MDNLSNKLSAFIIDVGTHAEWSRKPDLSGSDAITCSVKTLSPEYASYPYVNADSLVFSHGIVVEDCKVELMVGIVPDSERVFNFGNADCYSPAHLSALRSKLHKIAQYGYDIPPASAFRQMYRCVYGFDNKTLNEEALDVSPWDRGNRPLILQDKHSKILAGILTGEEDPQLHNLLDATCVSFVAARTIGGTTPNPVFWANGHYTTNATDGEEAVMRSILILAETHVQTRYLNSLFVHAHGFCPHLQV